MFHREFHEAVALCNWWACEANRRGLDQRLLMHFGNETGGSGAKRGFMNKQIGVRAGAPDYFLFVPSGTYHGIAIELKRGGENVRVSKNQCEMLEQIRLQGYRVVVARGWDEARVAIEKYLGSAK